MVSHAHIYIALATKQTKLILRNGRSGLIVHARDRDKTGNLGKKND